MVTMDISTMYGTPRGRLPCSNRVYDTVTVFFSSCKLITNPTSNRTYTTPLFHVFLCFTLSILTTPSNKPYPSAPSPPFVSATRVQDGKCIRHHLPCSSTPFWRKKLHTDVHTETNLVVSPSEVIPCIRRVINTNK